MKVLLTLPPIENTIAANFVDTFDNESGRIFRPLIVMEHELNY